MRSIYNSTDAPPPIKDAAVDSEAEEGHLRLNIHRFASQEILAFHRLFHTAVSGVLLLEFQRGSLHREEIGRRSNPSPRERNAGVDTLRQCCRGNAKESELSRDFRS